MVDFSLFLFYLIMISYLLTEKIFYCSIIQPYPLISSKQKVKLKSYIKIKTLMLSENNSEVQDWTCWLKAIAPCGHCV